MRKNTRPKTGIGVGYVTAMIVFATICLTIFAVLSFRAAGSDDALNARSGEYLKQYYAADARAKATLAELCRAAEESRKTMFFDESFEELASKLEGVSLRKTADGFNAVFSEPINARQELNVSVTFCESRGYTVDSWKNVTLSSEQEESNLNVWDGNF